MPSLPYTTAFTAGSANITNVTGQRGCRFWSTAGEDVTITHLGRWCFAGNSQSHAVRIYTEYYVLLGEVTIDLSAATPGQFAWGELSSPVVVPASAPRVYILSDEVSGGDAWNYGFGNPGPVATTEDIGNIETAWYDTATSALKCTGGLTASHGPVSFQYSGPLRTWTKTGTVYTTDGTNYQRNSAMNHASAGDTVQLPTGEFAWGAGGTGISVKAGVTLAGTGQGSTIVNIAHDSPSLYAFSNCLIGLGAGSVLRDIGFIGPTTARSSLAACGANAGWRITNVTFTQRYTPQFSGYFLVSQYAANGLIDNCTITGSNGQAELIFARGPLNAWQSPHGMGGPNAIFVEDCTFNGTGYICDSNSNGRIVVRFNTINGTHKADAHGLMSNGGPARGSRTLEVYHNTWTSNYNAYWPCIEHRGGNGRFFKNNVANPGNPTLSGLLRFDEYGIFQNNGNFGPVYQTPTYYPVSDQIGVGMDPKVAASEPAYVWGNIKGGARLDVSYNGNAIPAAAIAQYRTETGNPAATFTYSDIIQHDRDYFQEVAVFDGTSGVGIGTRAQMDAITPTKTGVGFGVTDEGSWNTLLPANTSGRLYVWDGEDWVFDYEPYTYPHPQRGALAAPVITASTSSQSVDVGTTAIFSVTVAANPAPTYQWRKDGVIIIGATTDTLTLTYVNTANNGSYDCVVTNSQGTATSDPAALTVLTVADITPPTPSPSTFASITAVSSRQITVVATTATDTESGPVEYNFAVNDQWTGWQSSPLRYFTELTPSTEYTFLTKSRDAIGNETQQSEPSTATTNAPEPTSPASVMGNRGSRRRVLGVF